MEKLLVLKRDSSCEVTIIEEKVRTLEVTLGLLDTAFAYLNIYHPTEEEKTKAEEAVMALANHWRNIGLSVTLKAHIMEKHVCEFNRKYGIGDKEESFIEQGHQVGIKDDRRYHGLTSFEKRTESTLKSWAITSHPLVKERQVKVLMRSQRKRSAPTTNEDEHTKPTVYIKKEETKEIKEEKRQQYVSKNKKEEEYMKCIFRNLPFLF